MKTNKQLTYEQRCQISVLKESGMIQQHIASIINVDQSTISRELRRNTGQRGYRHKQAQPMSADRRFGATKFLKMTPGMINLIIGKGHSGALVTIVERVTRFTVSKRINDKSAKTVTAATIALLAPYKEAAHTITADNGKEFAYHEQMTAALDAPSTLPIPTAHGNVD